MWVADVAAIALSHYKMTIDFDPMEWWDYTTREDNLSISRNTPLNLDWI